MSYPQKEKNSRDQHKDQAVSKINKEALQISKEIAVKFIETQRISPSNFAEIFPALHKVVLTTIKEGEKKE